MSCKEWKKVRLGDVCVKIGSGATPKGGKDSYHDSGISLIRSQYVLDWEFTEVGLAFIDEEQAQSLKNVVVKEQDVLINITGDSVARACIVPTWVLPARVNQHVAIIRGNDELVHNKYILCLLQYLKPNLLSISGSGGTRNALTKSMLENLEIPLPPLKEQKRIAAILGALDDKIELNNKINKNLEEQASALFKHWFVGFEFPDANGKPYKSSGGAFKDSELGLIPSNYKVGVVSSFFDISIGKTPPRSEYHWFTKDDKDVVWVSIANMGFNGIYINDSTEYITEEAVKKFNIIKVPSNTVILSFKLTVGRVAITDGITTTNEAIAHFKTEDFEIVEYLYLFLKGYNYKLLGSTSSIATAVNSKVIKGMSIMVPSRNVLKEFHRILHPIFQKIKFNQLENTTLIRLREILLLQLMSKG